MSILVFFVCAFLFLYLFYSNQYVGHIYEIKKERQNLSRISKEHNALGLQLLSTRSLAELETMSKELGMIENKTVEYVLLPGERTFARE